MKLIIDIPETVYNIVIKYDSEYVPSEYIKNGIPLDDFLKQRKEPIDKNIVDTYIDQFKKEDV